MKQLSKLAYLQLSRFSKPACDRVIYQLIKRHQVKSMVEVGLGDGTRCLNLLSVAGRFCGESVRYTGVDLFDARLEAEPSLKLIEMHKQLKPLAAKTQLVPGDFASAIQRIANSHLRTDLMIISASTTHQDMAPVYHLLPRMFHSGSLILVQSGQDQPFQQHTRLEVERWAAEASHSSAKRQAA